MSRLELVGRDKELKTLRDHLVDFFREAGSRKLVWLNLTGEDGIGKTRLLEELIVSTQALGRFRLLRSTPCSRFDLPYGAMVSAISDDLDIMPWESEYTKKEKLESRISSFSSFHFPAEVFQSGRVLSVLGQLIGMSYPLPGWAGSARAGRGRLWVFTAIRQYLRALRIVRTGQGSPETLVLWLEDLERTDSLTLELLVHLVQERESLSPMVVLSTGRDSFAGRFGHLPEFTEFTLGRLSKQSRRKIVALLEQSGPSPHLTRQMQDLLVEGTPGNPLLLQQAYRLLATKAARTNVRDADWQLIDALGDKVRALDRIDLPSILRHRLRRLDTRMRFILQCVAVLGVYSSKEFLSRLLSRSGYPLADLEERISCLAAEEFLNPESSDSAGGRVSLAAGILADLILDSIPGDRLTAMYQQTAEVFREAMEDDGRDFVLALGGHLAHSYFLNQDWAVEILERAAERLFLLEDYDRADRIFGEALARLGLQCAENGFQGPGNHGDRFNRLLVKAGRAALRAGRAKEAFVTLSSALQVARGAGFVPSAVQAGLELGEIMVLRGDWSGAERFCEEGRQAALSASEDELAANCLAAMAHISMRREDYERARERFSKGLKVSQQVGIPELELAALLNLGFISQRTGDLEKSQALYRQALDLADKLDDEASAVTCLSNLGRARYEAGQVDEALDLFHKALERLRASGDLHQTGHWLGHIGSVYYSMGAFEEAIDYYNQAFGIAQRTGNTRSQGIWLANLGNAYYEIKEVTKALEYYLRALELAQEEQDYSYVCTLMSTIGVYYFNLKQYKKARHYFSESLTLAMEIGSLPITVQNILYQGAIAAALGDPEAGRRALDEGEILAEENKMVEHQAVAQLFRGNLELKANGLEQARLHCEKAAKLAADTRNIKLIAEIDRALAACSRKGSASRKKAPKPSSGGQQED